MPKLRAMITVVYDADPSHYEGTNGNPQAMANIDQENYDHNDISIEDIVSWADSISVTITPN